MLNPGANASEFQRILLAEELFPDRHFLSERYLILFFYAKHFTYTSTKEACTFRDQIDKVKPPGARIVDISRDTLESHRAF